MELESKRQSGLWFAALMVIAMIFWGSSWPASKILTSYTSADIVTFWRFFFAFVASIPIVVILRINLKLDSHSFKLLLLSSLCNGLYSILYFFALNLGSAGRGGVLVTTLTPVFAYLIFFMLSKNNRNPKTNEMLGLMLGIIAGICLLDLPNSHAFSAFNVIFVICAIDWAILSIICQKVRIHPIAINFYNSLFSCILYIPIFIFRDNVLFIFDYDVQFWVMMFVVSILSTAIGTSIYYMGILYVGATKASTFPLLVPFTALLSSYFILGEIPSVLTLFGGTLAIVAIYLINLYKPHHIAQVFKKFRN